MNLEAKTIVVHTRLKPSQYSLLVHIGEYTKLRKSSIIRAAVSQWLLNAPEDLPLDLKIEITRANIQHEIDTIKNLRWTYHQKREAEIKKDKLNIEEWLPPHTKETIKQLEQKILDQQNQLDQWIKTQYQTKGAKP